MSEIQHLLYHYHYETESYKMSHRKRVAQIEFITHESIRCTGYVPRSCRVREQVKWVFFFLFFVAFYKNRKKSISNRSDCEHTPVKCQLFNKIVKSKLKIKIKMFKCHWHNRTEFRVATFSQVVLHTQSTSEANERTR